MAERWTTEAHLVWVKRPVKPRCLTTGRITSNTLRFLGRQAHRFYADDGSGASGFWTGARAAPFTFGPGGSVVHSLVSDAQAVTLLHATEPTISFKGATARH